ncbi:phage gp6-like head-tail connector protein [Vagococcus fluvialis]|nr:phage gp6-like head-tail connector protein [Vagococcus fluvialis]UDM78201.1 phage gp6-like head-tail connector protein [Vagococcus fluvialis]UDM83860.1 phage gp6-like head-tail connector protein [Vagococcus fluvialis]
MNTPEFIKSYKARFRIFHSSEDEDIGEQLESSFKIIKTLIGKFDPDEFSEGAELVFERVRYVRNESIEFFNDNFGQEIFDASLVLAGDSDGD